MQYQICFFSFSVRRGHWFLKCDIYIWGVWGPHKAGGCSGRERALNPALPESKSHHHLSRLRSGGPGSLLWACISDLKIQLLITSYFITIPGMDTHKMSRAGSASQGLLAKSSPPTVFVWPASYKWFLQVSRTEKYQRRNLNSENMKIMWNSDFSVYLYSFIRSSRKMKVSESLFK